MSSNKNGKTTGGSSPAPWLTSTAKLRYKNPCARGNTTTDPSKAKFDGNAEGVNGKVFSIVVTQANQCIDTHTDLAEFIAMEDKNRYQASRIIFDLTPICYTHADGPTWFLADGITYMSDVHINISIFKL